MKAKLKLPTNIHDSRVLIPMAKRRGIHLGSSSYEASTSSKDIETSSHEIEGKMSKEVSMDSHPIKGKPLEIPYDTPDKPSTDLSKKPRGLIRLVKLLPGRIKRFWEIFFPTLTVDQLRDKKDLELIQSRTKLVEKECHVYARQVSNALAQLGEKELLYSPNPEAGRKLRKVRFDMGTWDELFTKLVLSVDTKHLPAYVSISQFGIDPKFSLDIAPRVGHDVKWEVDNSGCRITVYRKGKDGLPDYVNIDELWKRFPDNKPLFTVPVGFGDNSTSYWIDPTEYPHLLVAGGTGWGKSNFINQLLCFWLNRGLKPSDLQLVLFDLKKGMEFSAYEGLPHLYRDEVIKTGIIETLGDVRPAMNRLQEILDDRLELIKKAGFKNLQEYNWGVKPEKRIPAIFIIYDEWAKIRLSRSGFGKSAALKAISKLAEETTEDILREGVGANHDKLVEKTEGMGKEVLKIQQGRHFGLQAEQDLSDFTNLSRAGGMYVILSTQHPSAEVISGLIRCNFSTKIILNTSQGGSQAALGNWNASGLEFKGRAILEDRGENIKVQTAFISTKDIGGIVYRATTGDIQPRIEKLGIGIEEILTFALHSRGGNLEVGELYGYFKPKGVARNWIYDELRRLEGQEVTVSGEKYLVKPRGNHAARKLERI